MGYGSVNVPGVSGPELAVVKATADNALLKASNALEAIETLDSLLDSEIIDQLVPLAARVAQAEADIAQVKDALFTNITGNPFTLVFSSLEGFSVTSGRIQRGAEPPGMLRR